ncbi:LysR family transcriptional regulator [Methylobacterium platani]|uniref:LysR family transcriptional regulator n=2 Tax=Methylobacterium platani TaxID=427683 RepID=A0A179SD55_9HYPH|nr:LysR family transcriptional regulator [Methylobacterium platani]KMO11884.1 LysR family transcriptional regulator [Methylobacterium platani JCM 14648]OAS24377.1 LysR family transcriptional regulator [Methylobacterium platani]
MADEISDIRLFVAMVAAGNLSAAARTLGSSPAVMSRHLTALENRLGVRLVTRTSRRFELTDEGAQFHERCLGILAEIDAAEAEAAQGAGRPRGPLRISAPLQWGRRVLAPVIAAFSDRYPAVNAHLVLTDASLDVVNDGLDIAIGAVPPQASGVIVRKILSGRRIICAAPVYIGARGLPRTPDDLKDHDCIRLVTGHQNVDRWSFRDGDAVRTIDIRGKLSTTSTEVVNAWVLAGHGIASRAEWDIAPELEAGRLVPCLEAYWSGPIALYASYASRRHLPPRIRVFMDFLGDALAASGPAARP